MQRDLTISAIEFADRSDSIRLGPRDAAQRHWCGRVELCNCSSRLSVADHRSNHDARDRLVSHVALHDVTKGAVINVGEFPLAAAGLGRDWRMGIHRAADEIERWATGQRGIAATRVAYVRGTGDNAAIRVVDSDGANEITVPTDACGLSPAYGSPTGRHMLVYSDVRRDVAGSR